MSELYVEARKRLVDWLERQLIGPARDDEAGDEIDMSPLDRYPVGVLHPLESEERGIDRASEAANGSVGELGRSGDDALLSGDDEEEAPADGDPGASKEKAAPIRRRRYVPPSSVGFSFCVRGDVRLRVEASAAVYAQKLRDEGGRYVGRRYSRTELEPASVFFAGDLTHRREEIWPEADPGDRRGNRPPDTPGGPQPGREPTEAGPEVRGRAGIDVRVRPHGTDTVVTVTLFNRQMWKRGAGGRQPAVSRVQQSLFETRLDCVVEQGQVVDYPRVDPSLLTDEEQELELQYRERRIFAVGHGAAVDWQVGSGEPGRPCEPGAPPRIWSEFLPRTETPIVSVEPRGDAGVLELERLAGDDLPLGQLRAFVGEYGAWVRDRWMEADRLDGDGEIEAACRILDRMEQAHERMLRGIEMLGAEPDAALAFRLANRAMHRQMVHFRPERQQPSWRPFQLGFLLATIESTVSERDEHRDLLDLIWFQTGGGKTEAYLGLIAFLLVWRRLRFGERGGGTAAFMRYTLRLLTRQQFERAAGLICALELLRREDAAGNGRLGEEPFTVGIWVGGGVCPNRIQDAVTIVDEIRAGGGDDKVRERLLLSRCPWCREPFDGERGYEPAYPDFRFHCRKPDCEFGGSGDPVPCRVVDESLYAHPPSLLIATIDKFARLAWEARAGAFFGADVDRRAPDLVLQDELHLISGPLGSVAGLYEAGIETVIRCRGVKPKYIASTATIRMAREQVRALYGREVAVFPPPGLSCDDSWFAKVDRTRPGRLYVGYLAPLKDQQHSLAPLAAALLAAPLVLFGDEQDSEDLLEAWWTNVVYHGSLRGVGTSSNAFQSDVREFGDRLIAEYVGGRDRGEPHSRGPSLTPGRESRRSFPSHRAAGDGRRRTGKDPTEKELTRRFRETQVEQLWSRHTAEQIAETFQRLEEPRRSEGCLDAVLSTNMVSVGLDVSRLALMIVNGQPLTTGEYVQATSRVGRGEAPGVVVANYYRHQARSLSHYESFRPFHESFYRFVEPSSVTPYTFQVRKRALHAALVIALRHVCSGLAANQEAGSFERRRPDVRRVVAELKRRVRRSCSDRAEEVDEHIDRLLEDWRVEVERCRAISRGLHYQTRDKGYSRLLHGHQDGLSSPGLWSTLHSMRNVESPAVLRLR